MSCPRKAPAPVPVVLPPLRGWTIVIPRFHPARLNELLGNRYRAARLKKRDRELIGAYCRLAGVPAAGGKRRVGLTIVLGKGQRGGDTDCYFKSLLDALKHAGAIIDDRRQCVELAPVAYERGREAATRIHLEDVDGVTDEPEG